MLSRRFAPALTTGLLRPGSPRADSPSSRGVSVLKAAPNLHTLMLHVNMLTDPSEVKDRPLADVKPDRPRVTRFVV